MSITSRFLSKMRCDTNLLIPDFSIFKVATNYLAFRKLGKFLMFNHKGNIYPDTCLPNTSLSFVERRSGGFYMAASKKLLCYLEYILGIKISTS